MKNHFWFKGKLTITEVMHKHKPRAKKQVSNDEYYLVSNYFDGFDMEQNINGFKVTWRKAMHEIKTERNGMDCNMMV